MSIKTGSKCKAGGKGIIISGSASFGNDPVPLWEAGQSDISCVVEQEALGQISVQRASFSGGIITSPGEASFGGVTIDNPIIKRDVSAQSGTAYFVSGATFVGKAHLTVG